MNKICKKVIIIFIFLFIFLAISTKKICGVGFEFTANEEIVNGKSYYTFFTYVASSDYSKKIYRQKVSEDGYSYGEAIKNEIYITPVPAGTDGSYSGAMDHYDVSGIMIHPLAINKNGNGFDGLKNATDYYFRLTDGYDFNIKYDSVKNASQFNYDNTNDYINTEKVEQKSVYIKLDENSNKMKGSIVINIENYNNNVATENTRFFTEYTLVSDGEIVKYKYYVDKKFIDETIVSHTDPHFEYPYFYGYQGNKYNYYYSVPSGKDENKIRISLVLSTIYPDGNLHKMFTSAQFFYNMYVRGTTFGEGSKGKGLGKSAANDMDNDLRILKEESSAKVSVGHAIRNENGTTTPVTFSDEVKNNKESLITEKGYANNFESDVNTRIYTFGDDKNAYPDNKVVTVKNNISTLKYGGVKYKYTGYEIKNEDSSSSKIIGGESSVSVGLPKTGAINGTEVIFFYERDDSRNIYIGYYDESGKPLDFARSEQYYNGYINLFYNKSKFEEKYITFQNFIVKDTTTSHKDYVLKEIKYKAGRNISSVIPKYNGDNYSFDGFNNSSNSQEFTVPKENNYYYVALIYGKEEKIPKYKIKYVDESGKEIATSSSENQITKNGVTVEKKSIDGYRYKGVLTSKVNIGSLNKASVDVKSVTDTSASKYISYGKQDVLVVFVYSKITYYLRVKHAIYNDTGGNYENLLSLIDINKDFKQEKVTNFSSKSLINNAYYHQYILKSNETDVKLSEKEYKTTNALYKFNSMYFLRKMYNFPILSSTYESGDGKNENGEVNVTLSKNDETKIGAILTYFYDQFPKRTVNVYRKYIDDKNNEIALISPTGKYTVNNFEIYKENQNFLRGIFYYGEKSTMPSVANNLKYITANEKDIYEYNGKVKITYYNGSNDKSPISNNYTEKGLGTSISISSTNSKNKKQIDIVFYYTKKPDPEWITVCPKLNFKTVADYLKNAEGKENVATNTCKEKDKTYECTDENTTTQELVVPIGEDIKPIVNVPKVILIDSLSYSYDNTRGGIWQEVSVKNGKYNLRVVGYKALVLTEVKIKQNDGSNFVSLLSKDKVVYTNPNINNNSILDTELDNSSLGENIGEALKTMFECSNSSKSDYEEHVYRYGTSLKDINDYISKEIEGSNITIDTNAYNGVKSAYATVKYKAVNIGITNFSYYSNISPYLKEGSSSSVLGGDNSNNESGNYERTTKDSVKKKEYSTNSSYVNVYAPLSLSIAVEGINTVDHTTGKANSTLIQNNAKLKVTATIKSLTSYTEMSIQHIKDKYLKAYYYKFGFKVNYNGKPYESGSWIRGGESIEVLVNDSRLDNDNNTTTSVVSDYMNEIVCMAVTKNIPSYKNEDLTTIYDHYSSSNEITIPTDCKDSNETTTNNEWSETLKSNNKVKQDAYYAVKATKRIASIGRIYDFRITDCTDVDFKSVFRDSSKSGVNSLSGIVYFSGIKELEIFNSSTSNVLTNRKSPYTIPLGPYKHTNSNYVDAPKMGYRISFDVKTTGKYVTTSKAANELNSKYKKYVKITPSYYYIKKDGTGYNEKITLYYKNASNKYVKFIGSGFKISYKPNDGYRNVTNLGITNITDMFTDKYVTLEVSSQDGFNLNIESMCTNYSGYVQSWYGEFKLPNTTIAVADGGSVTNPLTDGYIGVKFDIKCIYIYDTQTTEVSYNTPNKNASGTNTTQWDYEGYLGFKNAGKEVAESDGLYLQFPKGKLMISSQDIYEKIRGTVVFFDLDNRASNDFE